MSEPETEIDTLDRLESALARIAEHAAAPARPGLDRQNLAASLDRIITTLREALAATDHPEQI
ncbi:MAG TPA: hypothetical protein VF286_12195 [Acidiphilium sp.]